MGVAGVVALFALAVQSAFAQDPAPAPAPPPAPPTGGAEYAPVPPVFQPTVPGSIAQIVDGVAYAPADAPPVVQQVIWAANAIIGLPYKYGGGHVRTFIDTGYDCSGTVSFALGGAGLIKSPLDSSSFTRWGLAGPGQWITVFANAGHAYLHIAGIRLDTSAADDRGGLKGPRWRALRTSNRGYRIRHLLGL
jgi:cell wall-associated NlpC family hydrolase